MIPELTHEYYLRAKRLLAFKQRVLDHTTATVNIPKEGVDLYKLQLETAPVITKLGLDIAELEWTLSMLRDYLELTS
jgi:hypothetical protein